MKKHFLLLQVCSVLLACSQSSKYNGHFIAPKEITKNMMNWLYYNRDYMRWSEDFEALDTASKGMTKNDFLYQLTTGNYIPVKIKTEDSSLCYQLYRMDNSIDRDIKETIRNKAQIEFQYYQLQGQSLPSFDFVDLNGNNYNSINTKGKIVVFNFWFINCQPCREEIPQLNKVVQQLAKREDVVFIALAFDKADALKKFLSNTRFDYAIVPEKENYLMNILRIVSYPTHLIINKEGKIVKVIDGGLNELIDAINKEISN